MTDQWETQWVYARYYNYTQLKELVKGLWSEDESKFNFKVCVLATRRFILGLI